jgi:hypothetical protein
MWIVYDWSDGFVGEYDNYEEALKVYKELCKLNKDYVSNDGEFDGSEQTILARIDKQMYSYDTKKPVIKENDNGEDVETKDTYWDWKEEIHCPVEGEQYSNELAEIREILLPLLENENDYDDYLMNAVSDPFFIKELCKKVKENYLYMQKELNQWRKENMF